MYVPYITVGSAYEAYKCFFLLETRIDAVCPFTKSVYDPILACFLLLMYALESCIRVVYLHDYFQSKVHIHLEKLGKIWSKAHNPK
jgi:hypothetical protein